MSSTLRTYGVLLVVGSVALLGAGGGVAAHRYKPRSPVVRGLTIDERRVPDDGSVEAWLTARRDKLKERVVHFRHQDKLFDSTLGEAGVTVDVEATLEKARHFGHEGSLFQRLRESEKARRGEIEVPVVWIVDTAKAKELLATFAPQVASAPTDAKLDLAQHLRVPDVPGRALDIEESLRELLKASHEDEEIVDLSTHRVAAKVTLEQLGAVNIEKQIAAYETKFNLFGTGVGRAINIRNAAARIDGVVLGPGQLFSFNDTVGPRTKERGFALAPEIQGEELALGYGGGTCQTSTTFFAAAVFATLEVIERQSHSRPSSYAPLGLDATVSYPLVDLKIRNPLPYAVMIHAYLPKPNVVRVEILGADPIAKAEYLYGVNSSDEFNRRVDVKAYLQPGQRVLHQKGVKGYDVTSTVRFHYFDGREGERHWFSGYRPAPEIYWVAPGYDVQDLPPINGGGRAESPSLVPALPRVGG